MRPRVLDQYGLGYDDVRKSNRGIVYCQVTGHGPDVPERDRAAYDIGAFWSRAGIAAALTADGHPIPQQRGGMGDHMTGSNAAGAICAALSMCKSGDEGARDEEERDAVKVHDCYIT